MDRAQRLVTSIELRDAATASDPRSYAIDAVLEVVTVKGRRVVLLDDRGWGGSLSGPGGIWAYPRLEDLVETARTVVGPDEPAPGLSLEQEARGHWQALAIRAGEQGVQVTGEDLAGLPHDVQVGPQVHARLARAARS